jgi:hypothetical protein
LTSIQSSDIHDVGISSNHDFVWITLMEWNQYEELQIASWARAFDAASQFVTQYLKFVGERIADLAGKSPADKTMAAMLSAVEITRTKDQQWETALQQLQDTDSHADLPLRELLIDCFSYAHDGLLLQRSSDRVERPAEEAGSLLIRKCNEWWKNNNFVQHYLWAESITRTLRLANSRWDLDHGRPIEPETLAEFGGVTERRIRNLMAEKGLSITKKDGRTLIEAGSALRWLEERDEWRPSLWRDPPLPSAVSPAPEFLTDEKKEESFCFVPIAEDGSVFCPKLSRGGEFSIGDRNTNTEQIFTIYAVALDALQKMPRPKWRRPTKVNQSWTLVSADRWVRMTTSEIEQSDIHPL